MPASTIITLTTDFGYQDGYVGALHGALLNQTQAPINVVDICHSIPAQNISKASACLFRAAQQFPKQTIHICVVDPGVGSERSALLVESNKQWFLAPNNGVLSHQLSAFPATIAIRLAKQTAHWQAHHCFDGLHLFVPAACALANGYTPQSFGESTTQLVKINIDQPNIDDQKITGAIIEFDHFGNAITNIARSDLTRLKAPVEQVNVNKQHICHYVSHYAAGVKFGCIFNSDDVLEIFAFKASAQKQLQLLIGDPVTIECQQKAP